MRVRKKLMRGEKNLARGRGGGLFEGEVRKRMSWKVDDWCFNGGYFFCQRKHNSLFTSCLSSFAVLSSVTKLNTHTGEKLFVWFRSTFTGHESKHSCLQEEKITHLKWYPSLKLRLFHFVYTGAARRLPPLVLFQMLPGRLQHLLFSCSYQGETCNVKLCSTSRKEGCILFLWLQKRLALDLTND